jgi:hypothetical protein
VTPEAEGGSLVEALGAADVDDLADWSASSKAALDDADAGKPDAARAANMPESREFPASKPATRGRR